MIIMVLGSHNSNERQVFLAIYPCLPSDLRLKKKAMHRTILTLLGILTLVSLPAYSRDLKYSIAPNFFEQNPGGRALGPCHGGAIIDRAGNIYISTDTERGIVVFSPEGKFLRAVGPTRVHGLEVREENGVEYIYAARPADH